MWAPVWKIRYCGHDEGSYDSTRSTRRFFVFHYGSFHPTSPTLFLFHRVRTRERILRVRVARLLLTRFSRSPLRLRHFQHTAWCIERNRIVLRLQLATLFQRSLPRFFLLLLTYSFFPFLSFVFYLYIYIYLFLYLVYTRHFTFLFFFFCFVFFRFIISRLNVDK